MITVLNKKMPVTFTIAITAICAAIAFSTAYMLAMRDFNSRLNEINERQAMYRKLSEIDGILRQQYKEKIESDKLTESLVAGYIAGVGDDNVVYADKEQVKQLTESLSRDAKLFRLSDGSALIIYPSKQITSAAQTTQPQESSSAATTQSPPVTTNSTSKTTEVKPD